MSEVSHIPMKSEAGLILLRSGSTDIEDQGRLLGQLDVPLSDNGIQYADEIADRFAECPTRVIFCSPCAAAQQTAKIVAEKSRAKIRVEESLANVNLGLWHGKLIDEVKKNQPRLYRQWRDQIDSFAPPEGETGSEVRARISKTLQKMYKKAKSVRVVAITPEPLFNILLDEIRNSSPDFEWLALSECGQWIADPNADTIDAIAFSG
ncbi:MAG: histidine phosphatase family protein [Planctomycetota bacterium]